jgi:hypothetical protein
MKKINAGDLIYIPSEVLLYKDEEIPSAWKKVKEPTNMLVTRVNNSTYEVLHNNEYWLVKQREVYRNTSD